jgi:hypothetical protein
LEQAVLARISAISDPTEIPDPEYLESLRVAVPAALDYALAAIEGGFVGGPPIPALLLIQARLAARSAVGLDTVLRRYFAGYTLIGDVLVEEAEGPGVLDPAALKRLLRAFASLFDRLIAAVTEEYERESDWKLTNAGQRRAERVTRLLAGEPIATSELAYDFDAFHVGLVATGPDSLQALRGLAELLDCRLLSVRSERRAIWAWLGGRRAPDPAAVASATLEWSAHITLAIGEPAHGLAGWRLTHRQAAAALPVALRARRRLVRYADVALLASTLRDDVLCASLQQLYLAPLEAERDGGETARRTLRAYFTAGQNISAAAAALDVNRHTVSACLRATEKRLAISLASRAADVEAALRLQELG